MELRQCEESTKKIFDLYESLRQQVVTVLSLPKFGNYDEHEQHSTSYAGFDEESLKAVTNTLRQIRIILDTLDEKIKKFRKRLHEKDPVTGNPRYGSKTQQRVLTLLEKHDFIQQHITTNTQLLEIEELYRKQQSQEELRIANQRQEEEFRQQQLLHKKERARLEQEQLERQKEHDARIKAEEEARELHEKANEVRQARLLQQQQEQEWFDSIKKGASGVSFYMEKLKEATANEPPGVQTRAFHSLLTIFQQINAHPEETKYRRIRRNHEQFIQDVGRHDGGVEVLLAAGFVLGAVDDVPCYLSKEPDIERDMDGWSAWFDLNKVTLELLQQLVDQL